MVTKWEKMGKLIFGFLLEFKPDLIIEMICQFCPYFIHLSETCKHNIFGPLKHVQKPRNYKYLGQEL